MSDTYTEFAPLKYDEAQIAHQGWGVAGAGPTDSQMLVGFYRRSVLNVAKSKEQGKRIHEDRDYVKIQNPGETLQINDRPVQETDKQRWPRLWAMYVQGKKQIPDGIPVSLLFPASPSITDTLIGYNIHTVEQLANLSGNAIQTVGMGAQDWVNKAQNYLKQAEKGVNFHRFEKEMGEKDQQISTLQRQVKDLGNQLAKFMQGQPQERPDFDTQTAMINAAAQDQIFDPPPQDFSNDIRPRKQRADKGKPRGPRKETHNA